MTSWLVFIALAGSPTFCDEQPTKGSSRSVGRPSKGSVEGAVSLADSAAVVVLPARHKARCLTWAVPRLVKALERAGATVQDRVPGAPPLGVGDLGRAKGGSLVPYSKSHQAGRDVDLAFYFTNANGPVAPDDLLRVDEALHAPHGLTFDTARTWALVAALLEDDSIDVRWLFVAEFLKTELLRFARTTKAPKALLERAERVLHQPSDAPPHDNHLHLRIRCTTEERERGCVD